jgi:predicted TPR repeat methyltransferase
VSGSKKLRNPLLQRAFDIKNQTDCKEVYKDWAKTYDTTMVDDLHYSAPKSIAKAMDKCLNSKKSLILDLGCGTGLVGEALKELDYEHVDGVDFSEEMLAIAQKRGVYQDLRLADLTQPTSIPSAHYDGAICAGLFTHGHLGSSCIDEIFRTIKSGGVFAAAIREQIWTEMGFCSKFTQMEKNQEITILSKENMDNYKNDGANDGIYLVIQKLPQ